MGNSNTTVKAKNRDKELTLSHNTTDSPILPIAQIERLQAVLPDRVPWVFDETTKEAESRRREDKRVNTFIFVERIVGQVFGLIIASGGLYAAYHLGMAGHEVAASVVGGGTLAALVSAFIVGTKRPPVQ